MPNIMKTMATICECHINVCFNAKCAREKRMHERDDGKKNPISNESI